MLGIFCIQVYTCSLQVDLNMDPAAVRSVVQRALDQRLGQMGRDYRDPNVAPFDAEDLVQDYNACLHQMLQFPLGQPHCALEFLWGGGQVGHSGLLGELRLARGYLTTFMQQGNCQQCGQAYQEVSTAEHNDPVLTVTPLPSCTRAASSIAPCQSPKRPSTPSFSSSRPWPCPRV